MSPPFIRPARLPAKSTGLDDSCRGGLFARKVSLRKAARSAKHLVKHRLSTYYIRVGGDSMSGENIFDGDLLVVDRAEEATAISSWPALRAISL